MGNIVNTKNELHSLNNISDESIYYVTEEKTFYMYLSETNEWLEYIEE